MLKHLARGLAGLTLLAVTAMPATAGDVTAGDLAISHAYSRVTPKTARVGAGYLSIENKGGDADRLLSVSCACAEFAQVHEMKMNGGVMKMQHVSDGLPIPAGATVKLEPGGYHLMFINVKAPFVAGESVAATLEFERAGKVEIELEVKPLREKSGHKHH